jgi:hypothetical protein
MSTVGPLGGGARDAGVTTTNAKKCQLLAPWEALPKIRECPPSTLKTSMADPWEEVPEIQERPPSTQKMSTTAPLGGGPGDPEAPTIKTKDVDDGPPGWWCQGSGSAHHQR